MRLISLAFVAAALAAPMCAEATTYELTTSRISLSSATSDLPISNRVASKAGDGVRHKFTWDIVGVKNGQLEIIGQPFDADVMAWRCSEFDSNGALKDPALADSACLSFANKVLSNFVAAPEGIARILLGLGYGLHPEMATLSLGTLTFQSDGTFFSVRRR